MGSETPESAPEGSEVRPLTIKVSKKTYNVIRSITYSSKSYHYHWNKPIRIDSVTKFVKYKMLIPNNVEVKAWEIVISHTIIQREGYELDAISISVLDGRGNEVAELIIRTQFAASEEEKYRYELVIEGTKLNANSIAEFERYGIEPDTYIPWAEPVSLADFVNKLIYYYYMLRR